MVQTKATFGKEKPWLISIFSLFDAMTSTADFAEKDSREGESETDSDEEKDLMVFDDKFTTGFRKHMRGKGKKGGKGSSRSRSSSKGKGSPKRDKGSSGDEKKTKSAPTSDTGSKGITKTKTVATAKRRAPSKEKRAQMDEPEIEVVEEPKGPVMKAAKDSDDSSEGGLITGALGFVLGGSSSDEDEGGGARSRQKRRGRR